MQNISLIALHKHLIVMRFFFCYIIEICVKSVTYSNRKYLKVS